MLLLTLKAHRLKGEMQELNLDPQSPVLRADNSTSASISGDPLKVQIEYTDAKGDRLTVDKEVKLDSNLRKYDCTGRSSRTKKQWS